MEQAPTTATTPDPIPSYDRGHGCRAPILSPCAPCKGSVISRDAELRRNDRHHRQRCKLVIDHVANLQARRKKKIKKKKKTKKKKKKKKKEAVIEEVAAAVSAMFRVRATSFFAGFAVASGIAMFQLQRDVWGSHHILQDEVEGYYKQLEKRIQQLERATGASSPAHVGVAEQSE